MIKQDCTKCIFTLMCPKQKHLDKKCKFYLTFEGLSVCTKTFVSVYLMSKMYDAILKLNIEDFIDDET